MTNSAETIKKIGGAGGRRSRQKPWRQAAIPPLCLTLALVCAAAGGAYAQAPQGAAPDNRPAISDVEIHSGPRGMVLLITAAGPIAIGGNAADIEKATAKYAQMRITVSKARSGMSANGFDAPADIPVKSIALKEGPGGVEFTLTMRGTVNGPVMIRGENNQVRILLTKDAQPELRWSASKGLIWSKVAKPADPAGRGDIRVDTPDMKKMEAKAVGDTHYAPPNRMFTVKEGASGAAAGQGQAKTMTLQQKSEVPSALPDDMPPDSLAPPPTDGLVRYKIFGRDPFVPLVRDTSNLAELPRVENLRLVGVLEDTRERIALLEDFTNGNRAFAMRVGDPVDNGKVLRVHRDKAVFIIRDFDVSRSYTLMLTKDAQGGRAGGR